MVNIDVASAFCIRYFKAMTKVQQCDGEMFILHDLRIFVYSATSLSSDKTPLVYIPKNAKAELELSTVKQLRVMNKCLKCQLQWQF